MCGNLLSVLPHAPIIFACNMNPSVMQHPVIVMHPPVMHPPVMYYRFEALTVDAFPCTTRVDAILMLYHCLRALSFAWYDVKSTLQTRDYDLLYPFRIVMVPTELLSQTAAAPPVCEASCSHKWYVVKWAFFLVVILLMSTPCCLSL